jgi:hypothetical protein
MLKLFIEFRRVLHLVLVEKHPKEKCFALRSPATMTLAVIYDIQEGGAKIKPTLVNL